MTGAPGNCSGGRRSAWEGASGLVCGGASRRGLAIFLRRRLYVPRSKHLSSASWASSPLPVCTRATPVSRRALPQLWPPSTPTPRENRRNLPPRVSGLFCSWAVQPALTSRPTRFSRVSEAASSVWRYRLEGAGRASPKGGWACRALVGIRPSPAGALAVPCV